MDFGPSPTETGSLWTLQAPVAVSQSQPAAAPAFQQQAPPAGPQHSDQQSHPAAAEELLREKPLRSRLRGAKRKAGGKLPSPDEEGAGFPAELFKSPAERNSSLDRRRVLAPTLRSMR